MTWEDKIIEAARMAEEAAQVELEQFGCIEFEPQVLRSEWDELESSENDYAFDCACWDFGEDYATSAWPAQSIDLYELY